MRAACDLYEHPHLSDSEVWAKDAHNRSGKTRMMATAGALSIVALTSVAVLQYVGVVDVTALSDPNSLIRALL